MSVLVGFQPAEVGERQGAAAFGRVEGAVLKREKALRALAEVSVFAGLAQLVVALDGSLGGGGVHTLDLREQLVERVGLQAAPFVDGLLDIGIGAHVDAQAGRGVVRQGVFAVDAGDAMRGGEELELLGPRRIEELVSLALRLQFDLVLELLAGDIFVHEALAVEVEPEVAIVADDAAAVGSGAAAHVMDHRGMPLLDRGTVVRAASRNRYGC